MKVLSRINILEPLPPLPHQIVKVEKQAVSHAQQWIMHRLITSAQKVDTRDKILIGLYYNAAGNIGV